MNTNEQAIAALEQSNELIKLALAEFSKSDISDKMDLLSALIEQKYQNWMAISNIKMYEILRK
jgi:hypothetical protein